MKKKEDNLEFLAMASIFVEGNLFNTFKGITLLIATLPQRSISCYFQQQQLSPTSIKVNIKFLNFCFGTSSFCLRHHLATQYYDRQIMPKIESCWKAIKSIDSKTKTQKTNFKVERKEIQTKHIEAIKVVIT